MSVVRFRGRKIIASDKKRNSAKKSEMSKEVRGRKGSEALKGTAI